MNMKYKYYKYNHQMFRVDKEKDIYQIFHDTKKEWVSCMVWQRTALTNAIARKRASEISEDKLFLELI